MAVLWVFLAEMILSKQAATFLFLSDKNYNNQQFLDLTGSEIQEIKKKLNSTYIYSVKTVLVGNFMQL